MHRNVLHRSVLIATAVAGVVATVGPVQAGPQPPVDAGSVAVAQLTFALRHGQTLNLDLRAGSLSGGNTLRVIAQRCAADGTCDPATAAYQSSLASTELTIDSTATVADLRTSFAGHQLHVRWQPAGTNTTVVGGFETQGDATTTSGSEYQGAAAITTVELDGRNCSGSGAVGNGVFADTAPATDSPDSAPLSTLHVPATAPLSCG